MSALDEALDILPYTVTVDGKAVKEAVIDQVAKELCSSLRQQASGSSFDVIDEAMKQALAGALILTQQRVIANPPTFVKIAKKYQRRVSTPALSNVSSVSNGGADRPSRAESPEVSSSNILAGPGSSMSAGSLGMADFMNPEVLTTAKLWRFQKLSKAELGGLVEHYIQVTPSNTSTKGQLIKSLMEYAANGMQ
ncbi:TPA: hypothetical protein ACH3X3_011232 [Trebouxia sp. C0006]